MHDWEVTARSWRTRMARDWYRYTHPSQIMAGDRRHHAQLSRASAMSSGGEGQRSSGPRAAPSRRAHRFDACGRLRYVGKARADFMGRGCFHVWSTLPLLHGERDRPALFPLLLTTGRILSQVQPSAPRRGAPPKGAWHKEDLRLRIHPHTTELQRHQGGRLGQARLPLGRNTAQGNPDRPASAPAVVLYTFHHPEPRATYHHRLLPTGTTNARNTR